MTKKPYTQTNTLKQQQECGFTLAVAEPVSAEEADEFFDTIDKAIAEEEKKVESWKTPIIDRVNCTVTLKPEDAPFLSLQETLVLDFTAVHTTGYVVPVCVRVEDSWINEDYFTYDGDSFIMRLSNDSLIVCYYSYPDSPGGAWLIQGEVPRLINLFPAYDATLDENNRLKYDEEVDSDDD